jgi:hypothetical protein
LKSGDTMTGQLTLAGAPTSSTHAASKTYVDTTAVAAQGGAWQSWTPVVTYVPLLGATTTLGITVLSARWQQLGKTVDAFATIRFNSSPTPPAFSANGEVRITIPAACRADAVSVGPLGTAGIADLQQGGGTSFTFGLVYPYSTTVAKVQLPGLYGAGGGVWGGDPAVGQISTNDNLGLSLRYEVP